MVIIEPAVGSARLLGLDSKLSQQHAAHAQQRSYSIHAAFLLRKRKKGSADMVLLFVSIRYEEPAAQQPDTLSLLSNKKKCIFVYLAGKLSEFMTLLL